MLGYMRPPTVMERQPYPCLVVGGGAARVGEDEGGGYVSVSGLGGVAPTSRAGMCDSWKGCTIIQKYKESKVSRCVVLVVLCAF